VALIAPGTPAPEFELATHSRAPFTRANLLGQTSVLVFYPNAFSPVCSDQLSIYNELRDDFAAQGATLYAISCDHHDSQEAFRQQLGVEIMQLSDFEPKGAVCRAFGAYFEPAGLANRCLVIVGPDGVVTWSWEGEHPGVAAGANLIFDGLAAS
jgi:peroxiredoxin